MLRDVPPNVHNAFLSTLDARLGSGTGVGLKEGGGGGEGVGVAVEALAGTSLANLNLPGNLGYSTGGSELNARGRLSQSTLSPDWAASGGLSGWLNDAVLGKKKEEAGMDELAKRLGGMSFFYEDEIGQAKWQGMSCL